MTTEEFEFFERQYITPLKNGIDHLSRILKEKAATGPSGPSASECNRYLQAALDNLGHAASELVKIEWKAPT